MLKRIMLCLALLVPVAVAVPAASADPPFCQVVLHHDINLSGTAVSLPCPDPQETDSVDLSTFSSGAYDNQASSVSAIVGDAIWVILTDEPDGCTGEDPYGERFPDTAAIYGGPIYYYNLGLEPYYGTGGGNWNNRISCMRITNSNTP